ncbi:hypothetical protein FACS1894178_3760 [Bacteroidia bacterium]|nr:hypothetical protein FACS1894178_3760 [Bacteroidia bacterium]
MFKDFPYYSSTLEFNNSKSLFTYIQKGESPTSKKTNKVLKGGDYGPSVIKVDTTTSKIYANKDNDLLLHYKKNTMTIDSMNVIKWEHIQDSTKTIAGYNCFMATAYFRGCVYTVWYAPEIPTSFGPWKLNGCPGLILEATRDDKVLSFYATKINFDKHLVAIDTSNKISTTYAEEKQELINFINKSNEESFTNRPRGSNVVVPLYIPCLECDFIYELKRFPTTSFRKLTTTEISGDETEIK